MNFLLPQDRTGTLRDVRPVDIHSDRYFDLWIEFDDPAGETRRGRVPVGDCPGGLTAGDRVSVHFVMGVMTRVTRSETAAPAPPAGDEPSAS